MVILTHCFQTVFLSVSFILHIFFHSVFCIHYTDHNYNIKLLASHTGLKFIMVNLKPICEIQWWIVLSKIIVLFFLCLTDKLVMWSSLAMTATIACLLLETVLKNQYNSKMYVVSCCMFCHLCIVFFIIIKLLLLLF